jgi:divalent metal cation (Fe/Co/Zn/Cd) transporter
MVALLVVMLVFFSAFALLEMAVTKIEEGNHGALPNVAFVLMISSVLMKFRDKA